MDRSTRNSASPVQPNKLVPRPRARLQTRLALRTLLFLTIALACLYSAVAPMSRQTPFIQHEDGERTPMPPDTKATLDTSVSRPPDTAPPPKNSERPSQSTAFDFAGPFRNELARSRIAAANNVRKQEELAAIEGEDTPELIANLLAKPMAEFSLAVSTRSDAMARPDVVSELLLHDPRVQRILNQAATSDANRIDIVSRVTANVTQALAELRPYVPSGAPWEPTVSGSTGLMAFAAILGETDREAASLPVLVDLYRKQQAAARDSMPPEIAAENFDVPILSPNMLATGYACEQVLRRVADTPRYRERLTPEQRAAWESFRQLEDERAATPSLTASQCETLFDLAARLSDSNTEQKR